MRNGFSLLWKNGKVMYKLLFKPHMGIFCSLLVVHSWTSQEQVEDSKETDLAFLIFPRFFPKKCQQSWKASRLAHLLWYTLIFSSRVDSQKWWPSAISQEIRIDILFWFVYLCVHMCVCYALIQIRSRRFFKNILLWMHTD